MHDRSFRLGPIRRALGNRDLAIYTSASAFFMNGVWIHWLALGWLTWELTHSGFWLGAVAFAFLFPAVVITPFAGVVADRFDRRNVLISCQAGNFVLAAMLWLLVVFGQPTVEALFVIELGFGFMAGLNQPARLALVANLVRREDMPAAVGISSINFNLARFIGPAIAGVIVTTHGVAPAFAVHAVTVLVLVAGLWLIKPARQPASVADGKGLVAQIVDGFRYVARHRGIGPLIVWLFLTSLFARPVLELLPAVADAVFDQGAAGLAWLTSAAGLGALVGSVWMAGRGRTDGLTEIVITSSLVLGTGVILLFATGLFPIAVAAVAVTGFAMIVGTIGIQVMIQGTVAEEFRGRVLGIFGMVFRAAPALGALAMGWISDSYGLHLPLMIGAGLCLVVWLVVRRRGPAIRVFTEPTAQPAAE